MIFSGFFDRKGTASAANKLCSSIEDSYEFTRSYGNLSLFSNDDSCLSNDSALGITVWGDVTLYNKNELRNRLGASRQNAERDIDLVLLAYNEWGENCLKYLVGDFSFVIWDEKKQSLLSTKDQLGHRPFYYYADDRWFVFSNRIQLLSQFRFASTLDNEWIVDYLLVNRTYCDRTVFGNIKTLKAAHLIVVTKDGLSINNYWRVKDSLSRIPDTMEEAVDSISQHLHNAVNCRIDGDYDTGIELSGGLDSSALAAYASTVLKDTGKEVVGFTNVLPDSHKQHFKNFTDEWNWAAQVAKHVGIKRHFAVDKTIGSPLEVLDNALDILGRPSNLFYSFSQQGIYKASKEAGVKFLLSGYGGNEMVSDYSNVNYLWSLLRQNDISKVIEFLRIGNRKNAILRSGYHFLLYTLNWEGYQTNKLNTEFWNNCLLSEQWFKCSAVKDFYYENRWYTPYQSIREKNEYRLASGSLMERLETGHLMTNNYGLNYRYPLLHAPLLQYFHALPDVWKASDSRGRSLFRKVISNLLPAEIAFSSKSRNSSTVPFYKVELEQYFYQVKDYCLSFNNDHDIYRYVDKQRIRKKSFVDGRNDLQKYYSLKAIAMLIMFFEKRKNSKLHELK